MGTYHSGKPHLDPHNYMNIRWGHIFEVPADLHNDKKLAFLFFFAVAFETWSHLSRPVGLDLAVLRLTEILLPLHPESWD